MAKRILKLHIDTGYASACHDDEVEFDDNDMSDEDIEEFAEDELKSFVRNMIDPSYEII